MKSENKTDCNKYDLVEDVLKSFTRSAVRTKVMLCLLKGDLSARDLVGELRTRASTILHTIKDMTEENLVAKTSRGYALTNVGRIQALILEELMSTIIVLDQHLDFWLAHDISGIPEDLLVKIGMLGHSEMLKGDRVAVLKTQDYWFSEVTKSKDIMGFSPIIVPTHPMAIAKAIENGAKVELILTRPILDIVLKDYKEQIKMLLDTGRFNLYCMDQDIKMAYTVTDSYLSLGLFRLDGSYDLGNDLNCYGDEARAWGTELFKYHRSMSTPVEHI